MVIHTGNRTDIPAFYAEWFANRLREGYVLVRNPYNRTMVTKYLLRPDVVDLIAFCTKNPAPMLEKMEFLAPYHQYWFVTITPYGPEIEPRVPPMETVMDSFVALSKIVGADAMGWRYDPILLDESWDVERHISIFEAMAKTLQGYSKTCVISFIDLYDKVRQNYPTARSVAWEDMQRLTKNFVEIGQSYGFTIKPCGEGTRLAATGADCSGCMTVRTFATAIGQSLNAPANPHNRRECACYLTGDIGEYNTCGHLCRYCYANADPAMVAENMRRHDPASPLLIGHLHPEDVIHPAKQASWIDPQMRWEFI